MGQADRRNEFWGLFPSNLEQFPMIGEIYLWRRYFCCLFVHTSSKNFNIAPFLLLLLLRHPLAHGLGPRKRMLFHNGPYHSTDLHPSPHPSIFGLSLPLTLFPLTFILSLTLATTALFPNASFSNFSHPTYTQHPLQHSQLGFLNQLLFRSSGRP